MKKIVFGLIVFVLLFSLFSTQSTSPVLATGVGEGSWVLPGASALITYTSVNIDEAAETAPTWVKRFSDGIKISAPNEICYSFRPAQFGWVPKIMQLKKDQWISLATTTEFLNGIEAVGYACAKPSQAGTFALFAYYIAPKVVAVSEPGKFFTVGSWVWDIDEEDGGYVDIIANQINWDGYPNAAKLVFGMYSAVNLEVSGLNTWEENEIKNISGKTYPQNLSINKNSGGSFGEDVDPDNCRTIPFVQLRDIDDNVLAEITNTINEFRCSS